MVAYVLALSGFALSILISFVFYTYFRVLGIEGFAHKMITGKVTVKELYDRTTNISRSQRRSLLLISAVVLIQIVLFLALAPTRAIVMMCLIALPLELGLLLVIFTFYSISKKVEPELRRLADKEEHRGSNGIPSI